MNIGDVVQLKSGGPKMTVYKIMETGYVDVSYFYDGQYKELRLKSELLSIVGDKSTDTSSWLDD